MSLGLGLGLGLGLSSARRGGARTAIFTFTSTGTGADTGTLYLFYPASEHGKVVQATGNVKLGAEGNLTEQVIEGGETNTFIVTCLSGTGTLVLPNTYTRFSANTSDTSASNGWAASTNSPSLAFDIATFPIGLITFRCDGSNTISGSLPVDWKSMWYFYCEGSNTISGSLPVDWESMRIFRCNGSNTISGSLPVDWKSMWYFYCEGSNTISGNLPADWKLMVSFLCTGSNTISGITEGEYAGDSNSTMRYLWLNSNNNLGGLSAEDQEFLLKGKASRAWAGDRLFNLSTTATAMESMADTAIPGRWFSAAGEPTEVAVALKTLVKDKSVVVSLKDLTMPGTSGDGGGFPAGFGDWWRS